MDVSIPTLFPGPCSKLSCWNLTAFHMTRYIHPSVNVSASLGKYLDGRRGGGAGDVSRPSNPDEPPPLHIIKTIVATPNR
jgi:hypothetical protein